MHICCDDGCSAAPVHKFAHLILMLRLPFKRDARVAAMLMLVLYGGRILDSDRSISNPVRHIDAMIIAWPGPVKVGVGV